MVYRINETIMKDTNTATRTVPISPEKIEEIFMKHGLKTKWSGKTSGSTATFLGKPRKPSKEQPAAESGENR